MKVKFQEQERAFPVSFGGNDTRINVEFSGGGGGGVPYRGEYEVTPSEEEQTSTWRQVIIGSDIENMAQSFYSSWSSSFSFPCVNGGILTINGGATVFGFWWPGGTFTAVSIKGDAPSAYTWSYSNGTVTVTASGNRAWAFVGR